MTQPPSGPLPTFVPTTLPLGNADAASGYRSTSLLPRTVGISTSEPSSFGTTNPLGFWTPEPSPTPRPMNARRAKFDPVYGAWGVGDATPQPAMNWYGSVAFPESFAFKFPAPNSLDWSMLSDLFEARHK